MPTHARLSTANALHDVFGRGQRVSDGWNRGLSPEDAGLARAILGLCLRRWGSLNAWYTPKLKDASRGVPIGTQIALSMGLAQLAWLPGVAAHAAVDEAVGLVSLGKAGFPPHIGLVNAILRRAAADREGLKHDLDTMSADMDRSPFAEQLLKSALRDSHTPENTKKLWDRLRQPPIPAFVALNGAPPDNLVPDAQFPYALRLRPNAPFPTDWLRSGCGMVQDITSQALMNFGWSHEKTDSMRILDVCAAPGGKTTALARMYPHAKIFALEQNPNRAKRLRENLVARNISARVEVADSVAWLRSSGRPFDLILLDAPCSASGTLQKHPELNWIYRYSDIKRLVQIQENLLDAAISRLDKDGLLIYSVCSWFPEEGLDHLQHLESSHPQLKPVPIWSKEPGGIRTHIFHPDPLAWEGEGFQGFALSYS